MEARFIGDPRNDGEGPAGIVLWGHSFPKGVWTDVHSADLFRRLRGNSHFETREGKAAKVAEPVIGPPAEAAPEVAEEGGIPANWRELHWKQRVKLAQTLDPDMAESINTAAEADQVIEWHEAEDGDENAG